MTMYDTLQELMDSQPGNLVVIPKEAFELIIEYAKNEYDFHNEIRRYLDDMGIGSSEEENALWNNIGENPN